MPWNTLVAQYEHNPALKFNEILVPTVDSTRITWLLNLMTAVKRPVILIGETGTSKTATMQNFLRTLDSNQYVIYDDVTIKYDCIKCVGFYRFKQI